MTNDARGTGINEELQHLLMSAFPDPVVRERWLQSPSGILGGRTPAALLRAGKAGRVCEALASLEDGVFS